MEHITTDFKKRREELLLTQEDVAAALKVSVRTVANWDVGLGPTKKKAVEVNKYFQKISEERMKGSSTKDEVIEVSRSFINEVLLRNVLWQIAKDRADRAGEPENWKVYLQAIDADNLEIMNDLSSRLQKMGKQAFVPVAFSSEG